MRSALNLSALAFVVSLAGCGPGAWTLEGFQNPEYGGVRRASFELGCPEKDMQLTDLGGGTIGVVGCGKKAVYKFAYGAGWVNNSGSEDAPQAPPAQ